MQAKKISAAGLRRFSTLISFTIPFIICLSTVTNSVKKISPAAGFFRSGISISFTIHHHHLWTDGLVPESATEPNSVKLIYALRFSTFFINSLKELSC